jgi:osmotically-inducible protein OsmY
VNEALTQHPDVDASDIEVQVSGDEVTLTGTVNTRYEKRAAADCIWDVAGVRDVHNHIRVLTPAGDRQYPAART